MTLLSRRSILAGLAALPAVPAALAGPATLPRVDVALLMAVDASASIDKGLLDFQLRGHAAALRNKAVEQAIGRSSDGVAVMLAQFAGPQSLTTLVPWRVLRSGADCETFATAIDAAPGVAMGGSTALGDAVVQAVALLDSAPYRTDRRTIDIVSNGFSNAGTDPRSARGYAAGANVTVNALAILNEYDWLETYYGESVIAGRGAFVRTADDLDAFAGVLLGKLVTEMV